MGAWAWAWAKIVREGFCFSSKVLVFPHGWFSVVIEQIRLRAWAWQLRILTECGSHGGNKYETWIETREEHGGEGGVEHHEPTTRGGRALIWQ